MARERLDKVLGNLGYGTRKEVKAAIKAGDVKVNGEYADDSGMHVDPLIDEICVLGKKIMYRKYVYIMLNKPNGVISATEDDYEKTVIDLLDDNLVVFAPAPVGRLDKDTEGLLLLTNDGDLNHMLMSPKSHVSKRYYAVIDGRVTQVDVEKFKEGVVLDDGYKTMPAELTILSQGEKSEIEVVIYEGKYHQVKRMFEAVEKSVIYLKRMQVGPLKLDETLETGEYREITEEELKLLKDNSNRNNSQKS